MKGGEPDYDGVAKMVLNDFMRGKLPWFTAPPHEEEGEDAKGMEGRDGRLGEMSKKRKADDDLEASKKSKVEKSDEEEDEEEEWAGISSGGEHSGDEADE